MATQLCTYSPMLFALQLFRTDQPSAGGGIEAFARFSEYMKITKYANPSDSEIHPYHFGFDTKMNMFEYMVAKPPLGSQFNNHMSGYRQGRPSWMDTDFYPVKKQLYAGVDSDDVLLVDIGGGVGHDLAEFVYVRVRSLFWLAR